MLSLPRGSGVNTETGEVRLLSVLQKGRGNVGYYSISPAGSISALPLGRFKPPHLQWEEIASRPTALSLNSLLLGTWGWLPWELSSFLAVCPEDRHTEKTARDGLLLDYLVLGLLAGVVKDA